MTPNDLPAAPRPEAVPLDALCWRCDPAELPFDSTAEVEANGGIIGQDPAIEALRFGLAIDAPGQNIFVRGLTGTGRLSLVHRLLNEIRPLRPLADDCCFVHNFSQPDRPRMIRLDPGKGQVFRRRMVKLAEFVRKDLNDALARDDIQARVAALDARAQEQLDALVSPFKEELAKDGLALVSFQAGQAVQTGIFPLVDGQPVPPEQFQQLAAAGKVPPESVKAFEMAGAQHAARLAEIDEKAAELQQARTDEIQEIMEGSVRWIMGSVIRLIEAEFPGPAVGAFLKDLVEDLIANRMGEREHAFDFTNLYRVNVVLDQSVDTSCPVIAETAPSVRNLLGSLEYEFEGGDPRSSHMGIRVGSLVRADGGFLLLDARDLLSEPDAWKMLVRTLRSGCVEIVPPESHKPISAPMLKPEPVEINVKVVLIGEANTYYMLDAMDPDFPQLFKVLADFDSIIPRTKASVQAYAEALARIAREEDLPPFDRGAVAALVEHGARIAGRKDSLSTRFGRLADVAREAAFLARQDRRETVEAEAVREAVRFGKRRADLPAQRFRELVADGTIQVHVDGDAVGQVNGLAVMKAGPLTYGFPARITATIGPGSAGVINIEREAEMSGAIHTKGFYILGGLMRTLLRTDHPLAFDASIAFEQSYGGIDGDSASGAEICCLLSALIDVPLRQDLAMTGAIDQTGNILAIGGVNEKVEGFFDACHDQELTGDQGVIVPKANAGELMLRPDVLEACADGQFRIYAVSRVEEALEIFTGRTADALLGVAVERARAYWEMAAQAPRKT